jgi:hypothetical protein
MVDVPVEIWRFSQCLLLTRSARAHVRHFFLHAAAAASPNVGFSANAIGLRAAGSAAPPPEPSWAKPSIGIFSFVVFAAALIVTCRYAEMKETFSLLIGAVIANVTTVIGYYFGSSSGSTQKTALLAAAPPAQPPGG